MEKVLIGLGANLGDREHTLRVAWEALHQPPMIETLRLSSFYETTPVGGPSNQPMYMNAVGLLQTSLEPEVLLDVLQKIETKFGRVRTEQWGPRTIDLDLLLFGDRTIQTDRLIVPHPEMPHRPFVLEPAMEIIADFHKPPR